MTPKYFKLQSVSRLTIFSVLLLFCGTVGFSQEGPKEKALALVQQGLDLHKKNDYDGAIEKYSEALKIVSKSGDIYFARALTYVAKHDVDNSISDFSKALEYGVGTKGFEISSHRLRARMYVQKSNFKETVEDIDFLIAQKEANSDDFVFRGRANLMRQKPIDAVSDLDNAIVLDPRNESAFMWRANAYIALQLPEKALSDLSTAIGISPSVPSIYRMRAGVYRRLGKISEAEADERKAADLQAKPKP